MEDICRLCCSTTFVNNHIFDDETALYIKMSLYLPIKVFKNDNLPQKVCDKCSCKVNDIYQFCNQTIEVQHRLRKALSPNSYIDDTFDLARVKHNASPPPTTKVRCEQGTQTEAPHLLTPAYEIQVKVEPKSTSPIKIEDYSTPGFDDRSSDEDITLIKLKTSKNNSKLGNGKVPKKRGRKRKVDNMDGWKMLMNALPEGALSVVDKGALTEVSEVSLDVVKEEVDLKPGRKEGEDELFHCCVCLVQCYGRTEMLKHYRQHAAEVSNVAPPTPPPPPEPLRCNRCRKAVSEGEWASHWTRHWARDRRPYRCSTCAKTFRDPSQIFKHGLTHNYTEESTVEPAEKRFVCDLCPEGFVYMRHLLAHRARAHPEASARALQLRCAVCARVFAHINSLHRHLRAHSGERNFLCNVCGKALSSREHLKFHIRIHTGYKPNVCKTCGKGFVKKCNLTLHERVHSGEKPHVCSHCGKAFSQRSTLVIHERYHSGARPYVCGLCGRGFVAKGLLSMHLKTTCI